MNSCIGKRIQTSIKNILKLLKDVGMAVLKTTETRCRDGSTCAGKTCYIKTTQITPSLHMFLLQTAFLNNLMACIACKIISGKKDVGMGWGYLCSL